MTELTDPIPLNSAIWVAYDDGHRKLWLICAACDLKSIIKPQAKMHSATDCLHISGNYVEDRFAIVESVNAVQVVVPCRYVTYIGLGPEIEFVRGEDQKLLWIQPTAPGPTEGSMSLEKIRATLKELRDPD